MPMLGQASGGWTESSSALRILHVGVRNTVGVLTDDSFTQTNPPIVTAAATVTTQVNTALLGVLSGSVAFTRPDGGSNFIGGPVAPAATANTRPLGIFINTANGNSFENTPGTASGKGPYVSSQGTYGNSLYETAVLTGANAGNAVTAYAAGQQLFASRNGYLTNAIAADYAVNTAEQCYEGNSATFNVCTLIGILKMPADATQGELVYDQRI
jgi:hypothetical protein